MNVQSEEIIGEGKKLAFKWLQCYKMRRETLKVFSDYLTADKFPWSNDKTFTDSLSKWMNEPKYTPCRQDNPEEEPNKKAVVLLVEQTYALAQMCQQDGQEIAQGEEGESAVMVEDTVEDPRIIALILYYCKLSIPPEWNRRTNIE